MTPFSASRKCHYNEWAQYRFQDYQIFLANNTQKFSSFIDETSSSIIDLTSNLAIANEKLTKAFNLAESAKNGLKNMNRKLDPLTSLEGKMKKIETSVSFAENTNKKNYLK